MTSELRNIYHTLWSRFKELIVCYDTWKPIPRILHKQFKTLVEEYKVLALKTFKDEYDSLSLQYEHALKLYREAEELLEDCLASRPDELRRALNENLKQHLRRCNHLIDKMHKSDDRYEKELERIQALLPTCPHCEDIKEEELEQMRFAYYCDMEQNYTNQYDDNW